MKYFLFSILLFQAVHLFAQDDQGAFFIRPQLGLAGTQVDGDRLAGYTKMGLFGGATVGRNFSEKFSASFGLLLIQKGARKNADPKNGDYVTYRLNINYVDVPFQFTYKFKKIDLFAGLTYSQFISSKEEITDFGSYTSSNKIHSFDLGWMMGVEKKLTDNLYIGGRFNYSLLPMRDFFYSPAQPQLLYYNFWGRIANRGFYNNVLVMYFAMEINPRKKSE